MGSQPSRKEVQPDSTVAASTALREAASPSHPVKKGTLQKEGVTGPEPPLSKKHEVLHQYDFTAIDHVAVNTPPELLLKTIRDVVEYLTVTPEGDVLEDISKVRILFRWITSFDVYRIDTEIIPPEDSPLEYFMKIQCDLGDHAHMFYFLCQVADIPCVIINGMTKSGSYDIGEPVVRESLASQWNAVYINGEWRLIDTFWAVACAEAKTATDYILVDSSGEVTRVFENDVPEYPVNEFYFLCDPEHLIYTHFPDDEDWQLLSYTISIRDFERQIYVREQYFTLGITISEDHTIDKCTLKSTGESVKLAFNISPDRSKYMKFKYALYQNRTQVETEKRVDIVLERFVRLEHTNNGIRLKLRFPMTGKFIFDLFGINTKTSRQFELICSYLVIVSKVTKNNLPFPDTPTLGWGPNPYAEAAGLVLIAPKTTILETQTGICQVSFGMKGIKKINNVLKHVLMDDAVLSKHALARFDEGRYIVDLRLPEEGEYALKIYAKTNINPSDTFTELITYLIKFKNALEEGQKNLPFPNVAGGLLGEKDGANKLEVKGLTYTTNIVDLPEGQGSFVFKSRDDVKLICETSSMVIEASSRMSTKCKVENDRYIFEVDFPVACEYSLNVFGIENSDTATLYDIQSYLIQSTGRPIKEVHFMDDEDFGETITQAIKTSDGNIEINIQNPMTDNVLYSIIQRRDANEDVNGHNITVDMSKSRIMVNITEDGEYIMEVYEREECKLLKIAYFTISKSPLLKAYHNDIDSLSKMLKPERTGGKGRKGRKSSTVISEPRRKLKKHGGRSKSTTPRKKEFNSEKKHLDKHKNNTTVATSEIVKTNKYSSRKKDDILGQGNGNLSEGSDSKERVNNGGITSTATTVVATTTDEMCLTPKKFTNYAKGNSNKETERNHSHRNETDDEEVYYRSQGKNENTDIVVNSVSKIQTSNIKNEREEIIDGKKVDEQDRNVTQEKEDATHLQKKVNDYNKKDKKQNTENIKSHRTNEPIDTAIVGVTPVKAVHKKDKKIKNKYDNKIEVPHKESEMKDEETFSKSEQTDDGEGEIRNSSEASRADELLEEERNDNKAYPSGNIISEPNKGKVENLSNDANKSNTNENKSSGKKTAEMKVEKTNEYLKKHVNGDETIVKELESEDATKRTDNSHLIFSVTENQKPNTTTQAESSMERKLSDNAENNGSKCVSVNIVSPLNLRRGVGILHYTDTEDDASTDSEDEEERLKQVTARTKRVNQAMKENDLKNLVKNLNELKKMDGNESETLLAEATKMVEVLKAREDLTAACYLKQPEVLEKVIREASRINHRNALGVHIILASRVLKRLKRTEKLSNAILEMNQNALVELKMYQTPPKGVHEVLMAAFILLGEELQDINTWQSCKSILFKTGPQYIMKRISNFNSKIIATETAKASKKLIAQLTLLQIRDVSKGAVSFYTWTKGMLEEIEDLRKNDLNAGHAMVPRRQVPPRPSALFYDDIEPEGTIIMRI